MFFLSYKHTRDFPKISGLFPKIYKDFPKLYQRPDERSQIFSENYFSTFLHVPSLFIYCNYMSFITNTTHVVLKIQQYNRYIQD